MAASSISARRPAKVTCQPALSSAMALALPMPALAPVMIATSSLLHSCWQSPVR